MRGRCLVEGKETRGSTANIMPREVFLLLSLIQGYPRREVGRSERGVRLTTDCFVLPLICQSSPSVLRQSAPAISYCRVPGSRTGRVVSTSDRNKDSHPGRL